MRDGWLSGECLEDLSEAEMITEREWKSKE